MRSFTLLSFFMFLFFTSNATTYYVNNASLTGDVYTTAIGNNANPGTSSLPFATLTFALTVATAGDVIIVDAGTYSDKDLIISSTQSGITIKGASITSTVFDGTPHSGIFNFMTLTGSNIRVESMTITEYDNAGAIDIIASSALDSSRIYFKDIYFFRNETFTSFDSNPQGGALWISTSGANIPAAVYCDNCHFGDNLAEQGSGGGAIFITGKSTLIVKDSRFSCNNSRGILTTYEGGAIFFNQAHGKLRRTFISGSKVIDQQGGAIRTLNNTATNYNLDIYSCTFTNNDARQGAAIYVEGKYTCTITNSLFYANNVTSGFGDGGTINCTNNGGQPTMSIINSTIANNNVVSGSDGAGLSNENAASYTVFNSIIWGNANFNVNATSIINATYCDIEPVGDMHTGVVGNINTNPLFTGGTDFTLQGTSPAINAGLLAGAPTNDLTSTLRSGNPDMGCFEFGSTNPITSLACTLFMNCTNPTITSSAPTLSICSGSVFSTALSSTPSGATYVWSSPSVVGITGHSNNGTGNISETLTNSTNGVLTVVYTITPFLGACMGAQITYSVNVNPVPTINSSAPVDSICSNTLFSTSLTSNTASGITSYAWTSSAVAGITGHSTSGTGNISETLVNTTGGALNVTYTITPSVGSCNGTPVSYTVTVNPVATVISSAPVTSICSNTLFSTSLSANTPAGTTTYSWTSSAVVGITGHATSGTGNISETLVNTTNGALDVSYTITPSFGGCAGTPITYTVTVNPVSTVISSAPVTSICSNTLFSTSLSANTSAGSTTYSWTSSAVAGITGHSTSGTGNISETLVNTTNSPLVVTYTITPSFNGCAGTPVTYSVTVEVIQISMGADQELNCLTPAVTINGSTTVTNPSYSWTDAFSNPAGTTPTSASTEVTVVGIYTLTITDLDNGCSITGTVNVTLNPDPISVAGNDTTLTCSITSIQLDATGSSVGSSFSYLWTGPSVVSGATTLTPTIDEPGTYTITVTDANTGCVSSQDLIVSMDTVAPIANAIATQNIDCNNAQITIDGSSSTGNNLQYSWTGSGIVSGANTSSPLVNEAGNYDLLLTSIANGCTDNFTVTVILDTIAPIITAGNDTTINCGVVNVVLDVTNVNGATYLWSGNGIVSGGNTSSVTVNQSGTYSVTVTGVNGCTSTDAITISFGTGPNAAFTLTPNSGQVPLVVTTDNNSTGNGLSYLWNFDNGLTSTAIDTSTTYTLGGTYDVVLVVVDSFGCRDTASLQITLNNSDLDIPNGFTPNGDMINDVFQILGLEQYPENKITIFNRWGELVFTAEPYLSDWDGRCNNPTLVLTGDKVVDGTYFFVLDLGNGTPAMNGYIEMKSR